MRRLREASEAVVNDWGQKLAQITVHLIEEPEYRLAGTEEAVRQVVATIEQVLQRHEPLERELAAKAAAGHARLLALLAPPKPGAKRPTPASGEVAELLHAYPKWRFQSLVLQQASAAFLSLRGHLSDELREINFCRVRLTELHRLLEAPADGIEAEARAGRLVLPAGCKDLAQAVDGFLAGVTPEALLELDVRIQAVIRQEFVALVHVCLASANLLKSVEPALVETAQTFAGELLGETNAAQLFLEQHPDEEEAKDEVGSFFNEAHPELAPVKGASASEILRVGRAAGSGRRPLPRADAGRPARSRVRAGRRRRRHSDLPRGFAPSLGRAGAARPRRPRRLPPDERRRGLHAAHALRRGLRRPFPLKSALPNSRPGSPRQGRCGRRLKSRPSFCSSAKRTKSHWSAKERW